MQESQCIRCGETFLRSSLNGRQCGVCVQVAGGRKAFKGRSSSRRRIGDTTTQASRAPKLDKSAMRAELDAAAKAVREEAW